MRAAGRICLRVRSARRSSALRQRELRAAARERDPEGRVGVFRERARRRPTEVSRFIDEHRGRFGVEPICRTLGVSASAYYQRATGERSARAVEDERLLGQIERVHAANYHAYGYRRTWKALRRAGVQVGRDRVKRLMRAHGIQGAKRRGKPWRTTIAGPGRAAARPTSSQRDFTATRPGRAVGGRLHATCAAGKASCSSPSSSTSTRRRVVGWQLAGHMRTDLVLDALRMALVATPAGRRRRARPPLRCRQSNTPATPSPRCSTTTACSPRSARSATPTTTRWPRASSTRFKTELIADRVWRTRAQLELAIVEYVGWFNHVRLHEALGDRPPAEFENGTLIKSGAREPATPALTHA